VPVVRVPVVPVQPGCLLVFLRLSCILIAACFRRGRTGRRHARWQARCARLWQRTSSCRHRLRLTKQYRYAVNMTRTSSLSPNVHCTLGTAYRDFAANFCLMTTGCFVRFTVSLFEAHSDDIREVRPNTLNSRLLASGGKPQHAGATGTVATGDGAAHSLCDLFTALLTVPHHRI
jgi:hypothetical protein